MTATDSVLFEQLKAMSRRIVPSGGQVWLYGSRARGDEHTGSDWDLLVLLNKNELDKDDFGKYAYPLEQVGWNFNAGITPILYTRKEWESRSLTPFYKQVERDKIPLL